jgi:hypothetical protein
MPYEMRGEFLEACDCSVPCPCWFVEAPEDGECSGAIAWQIHRGIVDGVDVSGLCVVSVSQHGGERGDVGTHPKMRVALLVDARADGEQAEALAAAFSGRLGGPLAELAEMVDSTPGVETADIVLESTVEHTRLSVDDAVHADMSPIIGTTGRITTIVDSIMSRLLSPAGEVGRSAAFILDLPDHGLQIEASRKSATRGRFAYFSG